MKNIFIKLFCLFTFILSFATCTVADETLGQRLLSIHNLRFLIRIMEGIRKAIQEDRFLEYKAEFLNNYGVIKNGKM